MSILINGIDLPNSGQIKLIIRPHGKVWVETKGIGRAEAIQIPTPHGRLIAEGSITDQLQEIEDITALSNIDLGEEPYDGTDEIMLPISTIRKILDRCITILEAED